MKDFNIDNIQQVFTEKEIEINLTYDVAIKRYTVSEVKELIQAGCCVDITKAQNTNAISEPYTICGFALSFGKPHCKIFLGLKTFKLYAISRPGIALEIF